MFGKTKSLFLIVASMLCIASCDSIREDLPRCELWLEFAFDYNMEYADAFNPQVKSVDVLVFDSDDCFSPREPRLLLWLAETGCRLLMNLISETIRY